MPSRSPRVALVDVLRGIAVAQMIVYHFIYDLNYFGWIKVRMLTDQPWTGWRIAIVSQFVLLVGVSLSLRSAFSPGTRDFWRRWTQIAASAALVSFGSALVFGPRFIWFGILHFVAAALLIGRPLTCLGAWNLGIGAAALILGLAVSSPAFNDVPANILGFSASKPKTEDYVPIFPWIGIVLIGIGLGALWQRRGWKIPAMLKPLNDHPPRLLLFLGTWALTVYLLHQPLLMGGLFLLRQAGL